MSLGLLAAIKAAIKTLDDRWSTTRATYQDNLQYYSQTLATNLGTTNTRVDKVISTRLRAPVVTVYTSGTDATYNRRNSSGASYCWVTLLGGGGGGGGSNFTGKEGGGGGGGERLRFWIRLVANPTYTVGTGGAGGAAGTSGGVGTSTWLNGIAASGGDGGGGGYNGSADDPGKGGGLARIYDAFGDGTAYIYPSADGSLPGGMGGGYGPGYPGGRNINFYNSSSIYKRTWQNDGGHTEYGIGGVGFGTGSGAGSDATGYGAGGGGARGASYSGGAGGGGLIIIEDYGDIDSGN